MKQCRMCAQSLPVMSDEYGDYSNPICYTCWLDQLEAEPPTIINADIWAYDVERGYDSPQQQTND